MSHKQNYNQEIDIEKNDFRSQYLEITSCL